MHSECSNSEENHIYIVKVTIFQTNVKKKRVLCFLKKTYFVWDFLLYKMSHSDDGDFWYRKLWARKSHVKYMLLL